MNCMLHTHVIYIIYIIFVRIQNVYVYIYNSIKQILWLLRVPFFFQKPSTPKGRPWVSVPPGHVATTCCPPAAQQSFGRGNSRGGHSLALLRW